MKLQLAGEFGQTGLKQHLCRRQVVKVVDARAIRSLPATLPSAQGGMSVTARQAPAKSAQHRPQLPAPHRITQRIRRPRAAPTGVDVAVRRGPIMRRMKLLEPQPSSFLRDRLRSATGKAHETLENTLNSLREPSEREYWVHLLIRFHGFHSIWESVLGRQLPASVVPRPRLPLIERDLRALGLDENDIRAIVPCTPAACLGDNPDVALGSVYVLEGSTLGGRVITRHLSKASWWPAGGLQFFVPYGDNTVSNWQTFLRHLAVAPGDADQIVAGALRTFEILQGWLVCQVPCARIES